MELLDFCKAFSDACQIIQKWVGEDLDDPYIENGGHGPRIFLGELEICMYEEECHPEEISDVDDDYGSPYYDYIRIPYNGFPFNLLEIYPVTEYKYSGNFSGGNSIAILILADMITNGVLLNSLDEYAKYRMNNKD